MIMYNFHLNIATEIYLLNNVHIHIYIYIYIYIYTNIHTYSMYIVIQYTYMPIQLLDPYEYK